MKKHVPTKTPHDDLAREVEQWERGELSPRDWTDAPDAVPRAAEAQLVSIRFPKPLLAVIKAYAERAGVPYQALIKQWLDERILSEREVLRRRMDPLGLAPTFPLCDVDTKQGPHLEAGVR